MVRYYSDDGVHDVPREKLWKLIEAHSDTNISKIHPDFVSMRTIEEHGGSVTKEIQIRGPDGKVSPMRMRFTVKPPHNQTLEILSGPYAGSWSSNTYIPEGNRTRIVTSAEWKVQGVTDEATALKHANDFHDGGFEADAAYLKTMR